MEDCTALLEAQPTTVDGFHDWCHDVRDFLYPEYVNDDDAETRTLSARLVKRAKVHAYKAGMVGLADMLPDRETKNVIDALVRLDDCLSWEQSSEPLPTDGPFTVKQAGAYLNVSPKTIYAAVQNDALRHSRIGEGRGTIRIGKNDLDNFMRQSQSVVTRDYLSD